MYRACDQKALTLESSDIFHYHEKKISIFYDHKCIYLNCGIISMTTKHISPQTPMNVKEKSISTFIISTLVCI